jgi:hypothetical protein
MLTHTSVRTYTHKLYSPTLSYSVAPLCWHLLTYTSLSCAHTYVYSHVTTGISVGSTLVDCDSFTKGLAVVAQSILEVSDSDVVILAIRYPNKKGRTPNTLAGGSHTVFQILK